MKVPLTGIIINIDSVSFPATYNLFFKSYIYIYLKKKVLDPRYKLPSKTHVRDVLIIEIYKETSGKLATMSEGTSNVPNETHAPTKVF